jgi:catechol 2,3-dioxygenase-like lactoylglutathione lyase family enzyme
MLLMPMVYVSDLTRSIEFYRLLGLQPSVTARSGDWAELRLGDAILALHATDRLPATGRQRVELCFASSEPLEALVERLESSGVPIERPIVDESFGQTVIVRDPDGLLIQIGNLDADLYT